MAQRSGTRQRWTEADVPDQSGRTAVVTGANTGLGLHTARVLAARGASVWLACRDVDRAQAAARSIRTEVPRADVRVVRVDLASLEAVREAAEEIRSATDHIDLLVNNAGVMWTPARQTAEGFEFQFGVNHLGHFALTHHLLAAMKTTPGARIVTVSSVGHKSGVLDFADLHFERRDYNPGAAYAQSKLANLVFAYELQRRLAAAGAACVSLGAHPGAVRTELGRYAGAPTRVALRVVIGAAGQRSAAVGALSILRAATDPEARGGDYWGPDGRAELRGYPVRVDSTEAARDPEAGQRLWAESERLTGLTGLDGVTGLDGLTGLDEITGHTADEL